MLTRDITPFKFLRLAYEHGRVVVTGENLLMGAFNTVEISEPCACCKEDVNLEVQFKYGDTYQHWYKVGDVIIWGGNDRGKPGRSKVVVYGFAVCPICDTELEWEVWLESDRIVSVKPATGTYHFVSGAPTYIVIEE